MSDMNTEDNQGSLPPPADPIASTPAPWTPPPAAAPAPDTLSNRIAAFVVLVAVVAVAAGAGIGWSLAQAVNTSRGVAQSTSQPEQPITQVTPASPAGNGGNSTTTDAISAKVVPAIVDIDTTLGNGQAAGTGMIISPTGEILTNNHVVTGSTSINVTVQGRSDSYSAHVVGVNVSQDGAVVPIDQ